MARDPAFLFYPGDWLGGTMTFSRSHKGAYMDCLMAQFNCGHLSLNDIKFVLGPDFDEMWESKLKAKFAVDKDGKFFNQKLEDEINKRKNFTKSRVDNLLGTQKPNYHKGSHKVNHKGSHTVSRMENENENENENTIGIEIWESVKLNFQNDFRFKEKFCRDKNVEMVDLEKKMEEFISDLELKEEYKPLKDLKSHFINLYNKKNGTGTHKQLHGGSTKKGTSTDRTAALKKW